MVADARDQFDGIRQLDQVIVGAGGKGGALGRGVILGGQDDDGNIPGARIGAVFSHQGQAIHPGHHQVLEDHRGPDLDSLGDGLVRVGTEVEIDVLLFGQAAPHRLAYQRLIVDQQHHRGILIERQNRSIAWIVHISSLAVFEIGGRPFT